MAEFQSPRFIGNPLLEEILNDPDTGAVRLEPGSPPDSVIPVQKALWDLGWTFRTDISTLHHGALIHVEDGFVDGGYGDRTKAVVLAYRTHYDIRFPPGSPTGTVSGFVGPRTLARLDPQCVLWDEAAEAITAKAAQLGLELGAHTTLTDPILGTEGTHSFHDAAGTSEFYYKRGIGAFAVRGSIRTMYHGLGAPPGLSLLGFPISDEEPDGPDFNVQKFENGRIRLDLANDHATLDELRPPIAQPAVF